MPVLVVGMHRSGTSALTRLIHLLGLDVGRSDDLMRPQPDNPMGFWESRSLSQVNDRLLAAVGCRWSQPPRWSANLWKCDAARALREEAADVLQDVYGSGQQWVWKDPRNCLTLSFWLELLPQPPVIVFIHRHPLEVITSLRQRNGLPPLVAGGLWEIYNRFAIKQIGDLPAFVLSYEQLLDAPGQVLRRLAFFLADHGMEVTGSFDVLEVQRLVAQQLRHYRFGEIDLLGEELNTHQRALYEYLRRLPEQRQRFAADKLPPASPMTYAVLDQYAEAGRQVEAADRSLEESRRRVEEAQRELDKLGHELRLTQGAANAARSRLLRVELERDRAQRELAALRRYYGKMRFRIAERTNQLLKQVPGAHAAARLLLGAAQRAPRAARSPSRPAVTVQKGSTRNDAATPVPLAVESNGDGCAKQITPAPDRAGAELPPGDRHYRAFVGPPKKYDVIGAMQFNLLTSLGLREHHYVMDIGCGSLRAGRLLIPYLLPGHYCGIEPEQWLVEQGIANEVGADLVRIKQPRFDHNGEFRLGVFEQKFDFVLAQSIFSHAASAQISKCLAEVREVMQPAGIFAATYIAGEGNYAGTEWVYPGCVHYTLEYLKALAAKHGLDCKPIDWPHPNGQTWVLFCSAAGAVLGARECGIDPAHELSPPHGRVVESAAHDQGFGERA